MEQLTLETVADDGKPLTAIFLPSKGMNLCSFRKGDLEIISQETRDLFEQRFSGLGPLIGPHFHQRRAETMAPIPDESKFPHIAIIKAQGRTDPFSHGIARYAPWTQVEAFKDRFQAVLTGKESWNDIPLSQLEGQNFTMRFSGELKPSGLTLRLSVVSDTDSLVGFHYFYTLPNGKGKLRSKVADQLVVGDRRESIPEPWLQRDDGEIQIELSPEMKLDHTLVPFPNPLDTLITLETERYTLHIRSLCNCSEHSWQLYHPEGKSFVCIEPVSALDPRHPNLTVSSLEMHLAFESK